MVINLSARQAKTLDRCLRYGAAATSQVEEKNGVANRLRKDVDVIRRQMSEVRQKGSQGNSQTQG